jgi:hypothetical protein
MSNLKFMEILTREYLESEYLDNQKSQRQIAMVVGCTIETVANAMKRHDIATRCRVESYALSYIPNRKRPIPPTKAILFDKYVRQNMTAQTLAVEYDVSISTFYSWLKARDVALKKPHLKIHKNKKAA